MNWNTRPVPHFSKDLCLKKPIGDQEYDKCTATVHTTTMQTLSFGKTNHIYFQTETFMEHCNVLIFPVICIKGQQTVIKKAHLPSSTYVAQQNDWNFQFCIKWLQILTSRSWKRFKIFKNIEQWCVLVDLEIWMIFAKFWNHFWILFGKSGIFNRFKSFATHESNFETAFIIFTISNKEPHQLINGIR